MTALDLTAWLTALFVAGCGSSATHMDPPGTLSVGHEGDLDGSHYFLEAKLALGGEETAALDVGYTNSAVDRELAPGAYSIAIQPGFQVLRDAAVAEVPVAAELLPDATDAPGTKTFEIQSRATTLVTYRFTVAGGTLTFDQD